MTVRVTNNKIDLNSKYRMSVQVSLTGLSFLLEEEDSVFFSKTISFGETKNPEELLLEIETAFEQNPTLNQPVFDLVLIHQNPLYTLVPFSLFKEEEAATYLKLNSRVFTTDFVAFDSLDNHELVNVYVPLANVNNYFFERYGEFLFYHFTTTFLQKVLKKEKIGNSVKMYGHLHGHQLDVVVCSGKKLLLCNSFNYSTPEDLTYYILFVAEQLELNPEVFHLELSGQIDEQDPNFELLYTYIRFISIEKNTTPHLRIEK